jgi:hypothetical protein
LKLTELQNKKQASNREEIEKRINLLENELKTFYEKKTEGIFYTFSSYVTFNHFPF